jgi:ketosteroid isomerase-like protein
MNISKSVHLLSIGVASGLIVGGYVGLARYAQAEQAKTGAEQRLRLLEDKEEIRELYARYMHYLDHRDMVKYSETFTEDGVVLADQGKWEGRAAMQEMFEPKPAVPGQSPRPVVEEMTHMATDVVIQVDGDSARAWGKYFAFFRAKPGTRDRAIVSGIGGYNDWLVRVNGHWLFKKREILKEDPPISF